MVRLSIIIPAIGEVSQFEDTLASVLSNRPDDSEIIVPHAEAYDDPYGLSDEVNFLSATKRTDPSKLVAAGIDESNGRIVHLLMPGCEVTDRWCEGAISLLEDPGVGCVSIPVRVENQRGQQTIFGIRRGLGGARIEVRAEGESGAAEAREKSIGPSILAAFYQRAAINAVRGWPSGLSLASADLDVALSLNEAGFYNSLAEKKIISTRAAQPGRPSAYSKSRDAERLFWRHKHSAASALVRPLGAALSCVTAGNPLQIAGALLGKLASPLDFASAKAHRQFVAATRLQQRGSVGAVERVVDDPADETPQRRAA